MMSGGNTQIVHVKDYTKFEVLGRTRDDAIGEAFDKVARVVGLGYPGGPKVDKLAKEGKANIELPKTHFDEDTLDFSFSGIKTAVINLNHKNPNINKADLCASFQKNVTDTLIENVKKAVDKTKIKRIVLAGGVSANSYIREKFLEFERDGIKVYMPDLKLCTDNAAMMTSTAAKIRRDFFSFVFLAVFSSSVSSFDSAGDSAGVPVRSEVCAPVSCA